MLHAMRILNCMLTRTTFSHVQAEQNFRACMLEAKIRNARTNSRGFRSK